MTPLGIRSLAQLDHYLLSAFTADRAGKTYNTNASRGNEQTNEMKTTSLQNMNGIKLQLWENYDNLNPVEKYNRQAINM